jgi:hypothetical protein
MPEPIAGRRRITVTLRLDLEIDSGASIENQMARLVLQDGRQVQPVVYLNLYDPATEEDVNLPPFDPDARKAGIECGDLMVEFDSSY